MRFHLHCSTKTFAHAWKKYFFPGIQSPKVGRVTPSRTPKFGGLRLCRVAGSEKGPGQQRGTGFPYKHSTFLWLRLPHGSCHTLAPISCTSPFSWHIYTVFIHDLFMTTCTSIDAHLTHFSPAGPPETRLSFCECVVQASAPASLKMLERFLPKDASPEHLRSVDGDAVACI